MKDLLGVIALSLLSFVSGAETIRIWGNFRSTQPLDFETALRQPVNMETHTVVIDYGDWVKMVYIRNDLECAAIYKMKNLSGYYVDIWRDVHVSPLSFSSLKDAQQHIAEGSWCKP